MTAKRKRSSAPRTKPPAPDLKPQQFYRLLVAELTGIVGNIAGIMSAWSLTAESLSINPHTVALIAHLNGLAPNLKYHIRRIIADLYPVTFNRTNPDEAHRPGGPQG